jgi:DNA-binding LytR/AlgR family response regulator
MMNCVIIDDEPLAGQLLSDYVRRSTDLQLVGVYTDPIEGLQFVQDQAVDLIFLDVQMPELTGIQFMKIINQRYPVILTTAYEEYALEGYEHNVVDYLLKPISYDRFLVAIQKAKDRLVGEEIPSTPKQLDYIFVKSEYRVLKINLEDILYLEGLGDYVAIHTPGKKILTLENMKSFEAQLPADQFMRVHKSYLIAFSKIDFIERNRVVIQEKWIPISDSKKQKFWERVKG